MLLREEDGHGDLTGIAETVFNRDASQEATEILGKRLASKSRYQSGWRLYNKYSPLHEASLENGAEKLRKIYYRKKNKLSVKMDIFYNMIYLQD